MSSDYITKFDAETEDLGVLDAFEAWSVDNSYLPDYDIYKPRNNDVLLRVFKYTPEIEEGEEILDEMGVPLSARNEKIVPYAKVISHGPKCDDSYNPGEIVVLPDGVGLKDFTEDFLRWREQVNEQPRRPRPEVFHYGIERFNQFLFFKDKLLGAKEDDFLTFLIPETFVRAKTNIPYEK